MRSGFNIKKHFTSEIDKHAKAIYKLKYPSSIDVGDVRHVRADKLGRIDVITFGSPCQDFSIAGKRKGMDGERSSLISEAIRLIDECRPKLFIWENVKELSAATLGKIFGQLSKPLPTLGVIDSNGNCLIRHGYYPQSRQRIYLVGIYWRRM